jgi:hypothetical protein
MPFAEAYLVRAGRSHSGFDQQEGIMGQRHVIGRELKRRDFVCLAGAAGIAVAVEPTVSHGRKAKPNGDQAFMMFPGNYTWSEAARAPIESSLWGGGELGEIFKVCSALREAVGNGRTWFAEWNKMGEYVASLAEKAAAGGYLQTASGAFMRACHYIQTGERLLQPRTAESEKAYARSVELFKRGLPNISFLSIEAVDIPFEGGKSLPAYFVKRERTGPSQWPTVVFFDGLDITKEMQYFRGVPELTKRGLACLIVDGPGNGESIRFRGMPLRYDTEIAGSAAVNYLETRNDVDKNRIGVMGISLGGYFAPRAAAFEKRFKACVSWGAIFDYHATWKSRVQKMFNTSLSVPGEHINWVLGVDNVDEALKKLEPFTLKGVAGKVNCPYLLTYGELDA